MTWQTLDGWRLLRKINEWHTAVSQDPWSNRQTPEGERDNELQNWQIALIRNLPTQVQKRYIHVKDFRGPNNF